MTDTAEQDESFETAVRFRAIETTLLVRGEVDMTTAPQLRTVLLAVIEGGHVRPVLDLSDLGFMDCSGLAVLIEGSDRLAERNEPLILRFLPSMLRRVLRLTGLDQLLTLEIVPPSAGDDRTDRLVSADGITARARLDSAALNRSEDVDAVLRLVVSMALASVDGAGGASITLVRHGELRTVAASDESTRALDDDQYALDSGPCVEASRSGQPVVAYSFGDEDRWPAFVERARERGIEAMMSMPLILDHEPVGAINISSRVGGSLSTVSLASAAALADEAMLFLAAADSAIPDDQFRQRIQRAVHDRAVVAKALGIVMAREFIDEDGAFAILRRRATSNNETLLDAAASVVASIPPVPSHDATR